MPESIAAAAHDHIDTDRDAIVGCFLPLYILMALFGLQLLVVWLYLFIDFIYFLFHTPSVAHFLEYAVSRT